MRIQVVLSGALLSAVIFGQKPDSFDDHVADYRLLQAKQIQVEVGITAAQREKLNKVAEAQRAEIGPYLQQMQSKGKTDADLHKDPQFMKAMIDYREKFLAVLSPPQLKRLRELSLQNADLTGILDVIVSTRIGMSPVQLKKARDIFSSAVQKAEVIKQAVNKEAVGPYMNTKVKSKQEADALNKTLSDRQLAGLKKRAPELQKIEAETKRQIEAVLTPKQLAAYRSLEGKPFAKKK